MAPVPWAPKMVFVKPHHRARGNQPQDIALAPMIFSAARLLESEMSFFKGRYSRLRGSTHTTGGVLRLFIVSPLPRAAFREFEKKKLYGPGDLFCRMNFMLFFFSKMHLSRAPFCPHRGL